jgi:hypothetical protein
MNKDDGRLTVTKGDWTPEALWVLDNPVTRKGF